VHDYHLIPLGYLLRAQGHQNRMGFFLHIPCPPPDVLNALPRHRDVMGTLASYDVVGVQTEQDCANLAAYFVQNGSEEVVDGVFWSGSRSTVLKAFPVGIDAQSVAAAADHPDSRMLAAKVEASLNGADLMIGVDRLDYSKGLTNRMEAISSLFERHPEWLCHATFLQIAPKSRTDIPEYVAMDQSVSAAAGNINGQFGDLTWAPIRYVNKSYSREELAALYRLARVGIVTPLRDGMNLVAKEYIAAQNPDDPGVLILSEFAGAAAELDGALLVNPYEVEGVATAIDKALRMDRDERRERYERMRAPVFENDIHAWARSFIAHLSPDPPAAALSQAG
jgi:trehalose 6-phosphate synthase